MPKFLVIERSDGGITTRVIYNENDDPQAEVDHWESKPTIQAAGWTSVSWVLFDDDPRPYGRESRSRNEGYRDAWEMVGGQIEVNMARARILKLDQEILPVRNKELARVSGSAFRQPPEIEALFTDARRAELQALRDLPTSFDLSVFMTAETLKAAWPTELPERD